MPRSNFWNCKICGPFFCPFRKQDVGKNYYPSAAYLFLLYYARAYFSNRNDNDFS